MPSLDGEQFNRQTHREKAHSNSATFSSPEFERLLDSLEAAALIRIHPKTQQKMARR
jgi:hypothetical protein